MEKWHVLLLLGVLLLGYAGYMEYYVPEVKLSMQDSPLNTVTLAETATLSAENFSSIQGLCSLTITPSNGYLANATLIIRTDDPDTEIQPYSNLPISILSGGTGNATISIPLANTEINLDILFTFTNTTIQHEVYFELASLGFQEPLNCTVYANPG